MSNTIQKLLSVEEWPDAEVVDNGGEKEVHMAYRTACHNYTLGFSLAFFMAATLLAYPILWQDHLPQSVTSTVVPFFILFSAGAFIAVGLAYATPERFYELTEGGR